MKYFLLITLLFCTYGSVAQDTCSVSAPYGSNPSAGGFARLNGISMYYEIYGPASAQPLLLIHGNGGSVRSMRCQIEHFKQQYKVIVADSRYHGKSENGEKPLTYELMADDYAALIKYLKLDSVYVLGQSDGGILTLLMAIRHPEVIAKGIAMAPNLRPDTTALMSSATEHYQLLLDSLEYLIHSGAKDSLTIRRAAWNRLMVQNPHIPLSDLSKIQASILVMAGDGDLIRLEHILEMYHAIPKSNLLIMPAATHRMLREEYALFNQMCERFLSEPFSKPTTRF